MTTKKEQKIRAKLAKQGFSKAEIEKIIVSKHKKSKARKIIIGSVVGTMAAATIVCVFVPQIRNAIFNFFNKNAGEENERTPEEIKRDKEIDKLKELISDEENERNKNELDEITNNKEKPENIVIPENATKEEKQTLEAKKTYLKIIENINRLYLEKFPPITSENSNDIVSTMTGINNIYKTDDGYVFYISAMNKYGDRYYKSNAFLEISTNEIYSSFAELNEILDQQQTSKLLYVFNDYGRCEDINQEIFRLCSSAYVSNGGSCELIDMSTNILIDNGFPPSSSLIFMKVENPEEELFYKLGIVNYSTESAMSETYDDLVTRLQNKTGYKQFAPGFHLLYDTGMDWEAYRIQNESQAQAQAEIDEISTRDANGKVTGMDWDEYQEKVETKKAQNAAKLASQDAAMDHTPLYSDKELSL